MKKNKKLAIVFISILLTFCSVVAMASASETRYLGDVSGDGKISATDARQVLRVAAMLDEFTPDKLILADTNEDGKITSSDARMVLRMAAMLEELIEIEDSTEDEGNDEITTKPLEKETTTKTEESTTPPNESTTKPNETTTETEKPSYKNEVKLDETLPENAIVLNGDIEKLKKGIVSEGNEIEIGDYIYTYCVYNKITEEELKDGWRAKVKDNTKDEYAVIYDCIYGVEVTSLYKCFYGCENLKVAPEIPKTIVDMTYCFEDCTDLIIGPEIPGNVKILDMAFSDCSSLKRIGKINQGVKRMYATFWNCDMFEVAPIIPNGVESIDGAFFHCENLKIYEGSNDTEGDFSNYKLPDSVIYAGQAFCGCLGIIKAPEIPQNARDIEMMFCDCTNLVYGPTIIPTSTMEAKGVFSGCENLIKTPEFEGDYIENIDSMYEGCSSLNNFLITIPQSVESCSDFLNDIGSATGTLRIETENEIQQIGLDTCEGKVVVYVKANCEAYDCIYAEVSENPNITIITF